jgi:hypothetical protein
MDRETRAGWIAVRNLVADAQRCLTDAITEVKIRRLHRTDGLFALGAIGAARSAVRLAANACRHALGEPPQ